MRMDKSPADTVRSNAKAVFFTHAGPDIGGGHLSRCFALSQALEMNGAVCSWVLNHGCEPRADALGIADRVFLSDPFDYEALMYLERADFAVVDTYTAHEAFFLGVSERTRLVAIDDLHDKGVERFAEVVINYGAGASAEFYASSRCRYLLGPRYALLRREYWELEPSGGDYALFVPGAADVLGCSEVIIEWWPSDGPELIVVLGPLVPECRRSNAWAALSGRKNIKILCDPGDFAHILSGAGFVICTASVTAYEALAMEKWTAVFSVAPNQDGLGATLAGLGAAYDLGGWEGMSAAKLVDAISFKPALALKGFVSKDGAILCADELLKLLGVNCDDR